MCVIIVRQSVFDVLVTFVFRDGICLMMFFLQVTKGKNVKD